MCRSTYCMFVILALGIFLLSLQINLVHYHDGEPYVPDENVFVILWWSPFGNNGKIKTCGRNKCYFTHNQTFQSSPLLKGILFYGSDFRITDLPKWRSSYVQWGLLHEESPRNNPILVHEDALNLFNYSSTFSRHSNVPLTLVNLPGVEELLGRKYFISTKEKTVLSHKYDLAPVLYIQSDCNTASGRDSYVSELMKYIRVDSYGACLNNAQLQDKFQDNYLDVLNSDEFLSFVARYKFTLAFENAVCDDYITEKLWRPLIVGSVPVYYGSPSFKDWLPNNNSAISVLDFASPKELATFLSNLAKNDDEYEKFLAHKLLPRDQPINDRLISALEERPEGSNEFGNYVEKFECFVCDEIHESHDESETSVMTTRQYDCPLPRNPLSGEINKSNLWVQQWTMEKCGAKLLKYYLTNNISIDARYYNEEKLRLYAKENC